MKQSLRKKDLRDKSADELRTELHALLKEQFSLRMQKATQQLTNHAGVVRVRRDIARVKTLLNQKAGQA
jgi:large subunit ribosomal protein L29